jgi:phenylalanyl-tRNA synthetase beta chain
MEQVQKQQVLYKDLPRYPEVRRDLSLLLDKTVTYNQIKELGFRTEKQILKRIQLFDVFEGEKIEQGKKSYAVAFILQDAEKTLTEARIDKTMKKLMDTYTKELNAVIR